MSASSRVSIPSPPAIKLRKRAKTQVLLGEDFKEIVTERLEPLMPPKDDTEYDEKRLKAGLKYADWTLRNSARKLSPVGERGLMLYKEACARLLDLDEGEICDDDDDENVVQEVREEYLSAVRMYERSIQFTACLQTTRTEDAQALQDELLKLQRLAFYARYGDILAMACRQLKSEAEARKVEGWKTLNHAYWTDVNATLDAEKPTWNKVLRGEYLHDRCPTHIAIHQACMTLGFSNKSMHAIISHYAIRNELLHSNMIPLIKGGLFNDLAKRLHDDFCDVPLVVAQVEGVQSQLMITLLNTMIEYWYVRDQDEPTNHQMWTPSAELLRIRKELRGPNPPDEADVTKQMSEDILKGMKKRLREAEKETELVEWLDTNLGLLLSAPKVKRVASSQLQAELVRNKRMKLDWSKLMNLVKGTKNMSDVYLSEYGELGTPPLVVHDRFLDDL